MSGCPVSAGLSNDKFICLRAPRVELHSKYVLKHHKSCMTRRFMHNYQLTISLAARGSKAQQYFAEILNYQPIRPDKSHQVPGGGQLLDLDIRDRDPTEGHSTGQNRAGGLNKNAKYSH